MAEVPCKNLYQNLYSVVQDSIVDTSRLESVRIHEAVDNVIDAFRARPYNELLLYFYTQSAEQYLITHITNNTILALGFANSLALSQEDIKDIGLCAFAHDFGMAEYMPFFNKTGGLSRDESRLIKNHTQKSADIFSEIFPERVLQGILDVHEQVDGNGYPSRKTSVEISAIAKLVSICDVFEALTHPRNFRNPISPYEAIKIIIKKKNTSFDGSVVTRFVDFLSIYPVGTLVLLNTNETAIVTGSNYGYPSRCRVKVLTDVHRQPVEEEKTYNLIEDTMIYIVEALGPEKISEISNVLNPWGTVNV